MNYKDFNDYELLDNIHSCNEDANEILLYKYRPLIISLAKKYIKYSNGGVDLNDLLKAFSKFLEQKELDKPLNTKITNKEYSVSIRSNEIRNILKKKKKVNFTELFEVITKEYVVVTFLSILALSRKQEIEIEQENNFKNIIIKEKGVV